jgi:hypothetical protein
MLTTSADNVKTFSFAEIIQGRDASVRVTNDGLLYAVDLVMVMTGASRDYAGQHLRRLPDETFSSCKLHDRSFPGKGNTNIKLVSFQDAIELIMVLPGKVAKETRTKFADIIRRYLAGDSSLVPEIEANAQSDSPIAQMARAADAVNVDQMALSRKRKLEELQIAELEIQIQTKKQEYAIKTQEYVIKSAVQYRELCQDTVMDERARLIFKDYFLNGAMTLQQLQITNGSDGSGSTVNNNKPISLSLVAGEMGLRIPTNELIALGKELKKRYVALHGKDPSKHDQLCDGRMTKVNSYMESDRPLMQEVLRGWRA